MKHIIFLEGFDRVGKDTQLSIIKNLNIDSLAVYIQDPNRNPPFYRNKEEFVNWLDGYLDGEFKEWIDMSHTYDVILSSRTFATDYVYSRAFGRKEVARPKEFLIEDKFYISNIIILWKTYEDYIERCKQTNSEIEYGIEEFNKIQNLYLEYSKARSSSYVIYVENKTSQQELTSEILDYCKKILNNNNEY